MNTTQWIIYGALTLLSGCNTRDSIDLVIDAILSGSL